MIVYCLLFAATNSISPDPLVIPWRMLFLPAWLFFYLLFTLGCAMILARIGVFFRGMANTLAVIIRIGFFVNPIFLTLNTIPQNFQKWYLLVNPLAGMMLIFRDLIPGGWILTDGHTIPMLHYPTYLCICCGLTCIVGFWFFLRRANHYSKYLEYCTPVE
jgi:ABC-type polysaccharide/polyol phosphate export permease